MKRILILTLIVAVIISAAAVMANNSFNYSEDEIAENSLHAFFGEKDQAVKYVGTGKNHYGEYYQFSTESGGNYYVDAGTYTVSRAEFPFEWSETNTVKISLEDAEQNAYNFIKEKSSLSGIDKSDLIDSSLLNHGSYKEYKFVFREVKDGVLLFNSAIVSVNPYSGDIISYVSVDKNLEISLAPEISEEKAIEIATNQFDNIRIVKKDAKIIVDYPDGTEQKLLWLVVIEGEPDNYILRGGSVIIDALSGEVYLKSSFK